jgi:hypothetical protein
MCRAATAYLAPNAQLLTPANSPEAQVKRAMNEINKMKRLRVAAEDEGEAVKIRAVKEAEAEASRTEIQVLRRGVRVAARARDATRRAREQPSMAGW